MLFAQLFELCFVKLPKHGNHIHKKLLIFWVQLVTHGCNATLETHTPAMQSVNRVLDQLHVLNVVVVFEIVGQLFDLASNLVKIGRLGKASFDNLLGLIPI